MSRASKYPFTSLPLSLVVVACAISMPAASSATGSDAGRTYTKLSRAKVDAMMVEKGIRQAQSRKDTWAVKLQPGQSIEDIAAQLGVQRYSQIGSLKDTFLLHLPGSNKVSKNMQGALETMPGIKWVQQQVQKQRVRKANISDALFTSQWHLDRSNNAAVRSSVDANVVDAWDLEGVDGTGVTIGIVDDGLQHTHPDMSPNYNPNASYDYNSGNRNPAPNDIVLDSHGTSVAGIAGAADDGSKCGVGAAYNATLAGIQLISAPTTDADEAAALSFNDPLVPQKQTIDVFNNSWGAPDVGFVHDFAEDRTGPLVLAALEEGVTNGRGGKGNIYVWAAGNGLQANDNVNYEGYANSRFTLAVGAVDVSGNQTFYSEPGAAMLITAPSNNFSGQGIFTTDLLGASGGNDGRTSGEDLTADADCRAGFGGTSASSPLVSGIIALMLEANPDLGWRDVQHILVNTAIKNDSADADWTLNGAGHDINHQYGFGLVDARQAVRMAKTWTNVGTPQLVDSGTRTVNLNIPDGSSTGLGSCIRATSPVFHRITVTEDINIEHVEVDFRATHTYRGDLQIVLKSPSGTRSIMAVSRTEDPFPNYNNWRFMSTRHWDESSAGTWELVVRDGCGQDVGTFNSWRLRIHGSSPTTEVTAATSDPEKDFDSDGRSDVLIRNTTSGVWRLNPIDGKTVVRNTSFGSASLTTDLNWQTVAIEDFTGDNKADVLLRNRNTGAWTLSPMDGRNVLQNVNFGSVALPTDLNWQPVGVGDFTGDDRPDVILRNQSSGQWIMRPMSGRSVLNNADNGAIGITPNLSWQPVSTGDFTGDSREDLLLRNSSTGRWLMIPLNGRTVLRDANFGGVGITFDLNWQPQATKDFTGDGKADVFLRNRATGRWLMIPMDGRFPDRTTDFGGVALIPQEPEWQTVQVDDFNGDGMADVLVRNFQTGFWRMHPMDGREVIRDADYGGVALPKDLNWQIQ